MGEIVMTAAVGVLTFNRFHLLRRTVDSLTAASYPFDQVVVDGGSHDPAQLAYVCAQKGGECLNIPTVGQSMNIVIGRCLAFDPDVVVFGADDYEYKPGWLRRLMAFWAQAPGDVVMACLNWEPVYAWNTVRQVTQIAGETVIMRDSIPGSSWSFRAADWPQIGPVAARTGGEDLEICARLRSDGWRLAALDLSTHIGERESAWGNQSYTVAKPLELPA